MEQTNEEEIFNFNEPQFKFKPNEIHEWRQQGYFVICKSCELQHAVWIGDRKIMVGVNDKGQPIFKTRVSISG